MESLAAAGRSGGSGVSRRDRIAGDLAQRYTYLMGIPQPIICALNGSAAGVGVVLALYSDVRIAARSAKLAAAFARRGLVAEHGIGWLLPRLIGHARAMEWLLSGRTLSAEEGERLGLIAHVMEDDGFYEAALAYARKMALECSPRSTRIIKKQLIEAHWQSLTSAVHIAEDEVSRCFSSEDFSEGVRHFVEKRPPRFTGN